MARFDSSSNCPTDFILIKDGGCLLKMAIPFWLKHLGQNHHLLIGLPPWIGCSADEVADSSSAVAFKASYHFCRVYKGELSFLEYDFTCKIRSNCLIRNWMKWLSSACLIQQLVGRRRSLLLTDDVLFAVIGALPYIRKDSRLMLLLKWMRFLMYLYH